ncbi:hypothetical protein EHQ53_12665 [Leptospira langatensis]|uniref:Uncharacterized protein n=1 Tax=Leptospira langatensis TaxID=2484983 RepID=A0A5F1ZQV2_9LEPT|nr:hypothetical protein [Leptospira langatensis]TGK02764.1 hypothetical protein EHO57_05445 [Leptospira langatensis]TGL40031.1 hypothetical protein EHQ53_12665 [Leptospira langatensis]
MIHIILNTLPILIFILVFFYSLWDRKKKESFSEFHFHTFLPAILKGKFEPTWNFDQAGKLLEQAGYKIQIKEDKLLFQNASTLPKYRNWLWSYGVAKKSENGIRFKLYVNTGAAITVPATLLVVGFYGLLVQTSLPPERVSIAPYFFLGFAFFFAISSFISQTFKERKSIRNVLEKN